MLDGKSLPRLRDERIETNLILDEKLDTFNGGSGGLGDGGRDTTH